jgi:glycosyltransferase involved in cell wall biosynthesis
MENASRLKVTFLLPLAGTDPIGGFKVTYEYANFLAARGHIVSVVHPLIFRVDQPLRSFPLRERMRKIREYWTVKFSGGFKPASWFEVHPAVKLLWVPSLAERHIPDAEVVIATSWETAEWAAAYSARKGRKFYLIQHHETWSGPEDRVNATWKLPLEKIVIARWLQRIAEEAGETAHLVHNGLDFHRFGMDVPFEARNPHDLLMLFHTKDWKGTADGLEAFSLARREQPSLHLTLFGLSPRPDDLPADVEYHQNPTQEVLRSLYNRAAIFLSPSWAEGFPLPPAEALQCGAALVATDIDGTAMYAFHGYTALLSSIKRPELMAENILRLAREPALRIRLAAAGHELIQQFTWETAGERFEEILLGQTTPKDDPVEETAAY